MVVSSYMANGYKFPRGFLKQQLSFQTACFYEARCVIVNSQNRFMPFTVNSPRKQSIRFPGCYSRNESLYGGANHCSLTMIGISLGTSDRRDAAVDALKTFYLTKGWLPIPNKMLCAFRDPQHLNVIAVVYPFPDRDTGIEVSHRMYETAADADAAIASGLSNGFINDCEAAAGRIAVSV